MQVSSVTFDLFYTKEKPKKRLLPERNLEVSQRLLLRDLIDQVNGSLVIVGVGPHVDLQTGQLDQTQELPDVNQAHIAHFVLVDLQIKALELRKLAKPQANPFHVFVCDSSPGSLEKTNKAKCQMKNGIVFTCRIQFAVSESPLLLHQSQK